MKKIFIKRLKEKVDAGSIYFKHFNFEVFDYALYPSYEGDKEVCLKKKDGMESWKKTEWILSFLKKEHYSAMSRVMTEDMEDLNLGIPRTTKRAELNVNHEIGYAIWQYVSHRGTFYIAEFLDGEWDFSIKEEGEKK